MVLSELPVPSILLIWIIVGQGPTALVEGVVWTFFLSCILSLLCLPLYGRPKVQDIYSVHPIYSILQGIQLELQSGRTRSDRLR